MSGGMARGLAAARTARTLATAVILVNRRPGPTFGLFVRHTARFIACRDVVGFAFLLAGVFRLVATRHDRTPRDSAARRGNFRACERFACSRIVHSKLTAGRPRRSLWVNRRG